MAIFRKTTSIVTQVEQKTHQQKKFLSKMKMARSGQKVREEQKGQASDCVLVSRVVAASDYRCP